MNLWTHATPLKTIAGFTPCLESWNARTDPAQIRLRAYLEDVQARLGSLPDVPLGLHLTVDVEFASRLTHHYDLENCPWFGSWGETASGWLRPKRRWGVARACSWARWLRAPPALRGNLPSAPSRALLLACSLRRCYVST